MVERRHLENQIQVLMAGRAAEQLVFGDEALTAGASSDLARAAELAGAMVTELGMWDEPAVSLKALNRACGAAIGEAEACKALLRRQYACVKGLLVSQMDAINALSEALLESESLEGDVAVGIIDAHLSSERPKSA